MGSTSSESGRSAAAPAWLAGWTELFVGSLTEYAVFAISLNGTLLTWQRGVGQVLGFGQEAFVGRPAAVIFTDSDREAGAPERELATALREGQALDERWHLRADGGRFWGSGLVITLRDEAGEALGFAKIVRDRTENRLRSETLGLQTLRLEGDVAFRTQQVRSLASDLVVAEQRERARISQLLHDELQQQLYALQMLARNALARAGAEEPLEALLRELYELSKTSLTTTRTLVSELSPAVLKTDGLGAALVWLAEHMQGRHNLNVTLTGARRLPALPEALGVLVFGCVQELLFNVVKHAGVARAGVTVRSLGDRLLLEVWDEGRGFAAPPEAVLNNPERGGGGFGLGSVRRRLEPFGGSVLFASVPGAGTRVTLEVPLG